MSKETEYRKEQFLKNAAFLRLVRSYELYQKLLQEAEGDRIDVIKERMSKVFRKRDLPSEDEPDIDLSELSIAKEVDRVSAEALNLCEEGTFRAEDLASIFAGSLVAERFLNVWNPQEGNEDGSVILANEAVGYNIEDSNISLHIRPTPVSGSEELLIKVLEGFSKVAQKIKSGELGKIENIVMESWMLAGSMLDKAKILLGEDIVVEEAESSDQNISLPLNYNARSLEKYLTAEKEEEGLPKIGKVVMAKDQFIKRFG